MDVRIRTIPQILEFHHETAPSDTAFIFLKNGNELESSVTYGDLRRHALALAAELAFQIRPGDRVLLLFSSGLDFTIGFFATLYARAVAVPLAPPRRDFERLRRVVSDCHPALIVAPARVLEKLPADILKQCRTCASDGFPLAAREAPRGGALPLDSEVAVLQYTSGSVGTPKGVVLTHRNVIANERYIAERFGHSQGFVGLSWLPVFHDMGLFGGLLQPLFMRGTAIMMSPFSFLQRPARWLKAISDFQVESSGAPNFAYEHCVNRIDVSDLEADLSKWSVAFVGAEPIRARTLDRFAEKFGPLGFRKESLYPCYGLAEATLLVTGSDRSAVPLTTNRSAEQTQAGATIVSSGKVHLKAPLVIADPHGEQILEDDREGEICVGGASVSQGYWGAIPHRTLQLRIGDDELEFIRTKDLGFVRDGHLFVVGRLDDLIVTDGRNFHPSDLEDLVSEVEELSLCRAAAFAVSCDQKNHVILAVEVPKRGTEREADWSEALFRMRALAAERHDLLLSSVQFVAEDALPRTTSGKIRRSACRDLFLRSDLPALASWETSEMRSLLRERQATSN